MIMLDFVSEIVRNSISVFFGLLQTIVVVSFGALIKLYGDSRQTKADLNAAFCKIRALEERLNNLEEERD